jgi:dephospho-CoA kinase
MRRPFVVGICGGIGSGKSAAARVFERLGARVADADRIAHELLSEPEVRALVRARFGEAVMAGGAVDRKALAAAVFGGSARHDEDRQALEAILHPRILGRIESELRRARAETPPPPVFVIDAPLLTESPLRTMCDEIVYVDAPEDARLARTRVERNWTAEEHRAREKAQADLDRRRRAASRVLDNRGTVQDLERACASLYAAWTRGP